MKEVNFKYLNKRGQKSERRVLVVEDTVDFIEGIDLTRLPEDKAKNAVSMAKGNNFSTDDFMDAYRKFSKKNMTGIKEELL